MRRLRELREQKGYTLEYVAGQLGLRNQYISNYELGKRSPDYKTLDKIASFYNVSVDYLLGRCDSANENPNELKDIYFRFAKEAEEIGLDQDDMNEIIAVYKRHKERSTKD